jgi:squalene-associated FAD-dependent desaturase
MATARAEPIVTESSVSMSNRTIVIGGGLAGLAAAVALSGRGLPVTLLESRPRLGGRAASFVDRETGTPIDNCQHVSMGCCTNFQDFCDTVGLSAAFRREPVLYFIGPDRHVNRFTAGRLPAPLHLLPAFYKLSYLSRDDRRCLGSGLRALARTNAQQWAQRSFLEWLQEHDQTPAAIERFWHVVLVSALSETPDRIDVGHARKVFVDAFLGHRRGWEVHVPTVPLDDLYGTVLTDWLARHGAEVRLQAGVARMHLDGETITAVELRNGERLTADKFVLAVPHHRVLALLPRELHAHRQLADLQQLESAPISSVHLWFDRPITELPHAVLVERLSQWMFNRSVLQRGQGFGVGGQGTANGGQLESLGAESDAWYYYQVVISASRNLTGRSQESVISQVRAELADIWPIAAQATLQHARLVTEHRAVFSPLPGVDAWRPNQQSPVPNLQFAGDWTDTGWPATMEGAVRSGYLAAENILAQIGRPTRILQADLPVGVLPRMLLRL